MKKFYSHFSRFILAAVLLFVAVPTKAQVSQVFQYTGNTQTFTVPSGVTSIEVKAWGAGGGGSNANSEGGSGGSGGFVKATMAVKGGQVLTIQVGGGGRSGAGVKAGGYAGGGTGGRNSGSGGGYSAVFNSTTINQSSIRILAGGGGGGAYYNKSTYGGAGGGSNAANLSNQITGGKRGNASENGAAGTFEGSTRGAASGTVLQGGKGSTDYAVLFWTQDYDNGGGGGGGGYRGGGGGVGSNDGIWWWEPDYQSTGGGGGSSFTHTNEEIVTEVFANVIGNIGSSGTTVPAPGTSETGYLQGVGFGGANRNNGGNGLVIITYTEAACSGTPTGGTTVLTPNTGPASSIFTGSVTGSTQGALGLTYQWQISMSNSPYAWSDIPGATSATAQLVAENLPPGSKVYYRRAITCTNSNPTSTRYSAAAEYTIFAPSYCDPESFTYNDYFVQDVRFMGTRNDVENLSNGFSAIPRGYQDWTGLGNYASQEQGAAVNLAVTNSKEAAMGAWVDWNNNGTFESGERVYDTGNYRIKSTIFGFTVPAGQSPGYYRIRIRVSASNISDNATCDNFSNGETEDYLLQVVPSCSAKIVSFTAPERCGQGNVVITMQSTDATHIRVYDSETANNPIAVVSVNDGTAMFTAAKLAETKSYYMAPMVRNGCESYHRVKITAKVNPLPNIGFDNTVTEFCGDISGAQTLEFTAVGDKETVELLTENFDNGLGSFVSSYGGQNIPGTNWAHRTSNYKPGSPAIMQPAIASGIPGDGFAGVITAATSGGQNRYRYLTSSASWNTTDFINLHLDYSIFTFFEGVSPSVEAVRVEVSADNGSSWTAVKTYTPGNTGNTGLPNKFSTESLDLSSYINMTELKIRFALTAYAGSNWSEDIAAVDKIRLYGEKPLAAAFSWNVTENDPILFNEDCVTPYNGATNSVCVKPTAALLETRSSWTVTTNATLSNGCSATGTLTLVNNNKTWGPNTAVNWDVPNAWKPAGIPDSTKCVRLPAAAPTQLNVNIPLARAKNITVESGKNLTVLANSALQVEDYIRNLGDGENFTVQSDANLIQVNDGAVNTGNVKVLRESRMKRLDYTYWSSPVQNQVLKTFSPNTVNSRFYEYTEATDLFTTVPSTSTFTEAKGYAIRAPNNFPATGNAVFDGTFKGVPNNGEKTFVLSYTPVTTPPFPATHVEAGYNLVGNPYPSNIDFEELADSNASLIDKKAWFWTNTHPNPPGQSGSAYTGENYAIYSGSGGIPATHTAGEYGTSATPTQYIKTGQGFMVKAKAGSNGKPLIFKNNVRKKEAAPFFPARSVSNKDRFWLQLITPAQNVYTALVAYVPGATNELDSDYDVKRMGTPSDNLFSILGEDRLAIQGRMSPLNTEDRVSLGITAFEAGTYTLRISSVEGLFNGLQEIYLKDKLTGTVTKLSEEEYTFSSEAGDYTGRFELLYQPESILSAGAAETGKIEVYRSGEDFVVRSLQRNIDAVDLFDLSGRLLYSVSKENGKGSTEVRVPAATLSNGVYVLKIGSEGRVTSRKVLKQ